MAYKITLIYDKFRIFRKANETFTKCRKAKCIRLQDSRSFNREEAQVLIDEKEAKRSKRQKVSEKEEGAKAGPATQ